MIVLISGKQGSGKTTLTSEIAKELWARHKIVTTEFMFAETIKEIHKFALAAAAAA